METRDIALIKALSNGAGGASYTLPIASETTLGGVQPAAKTDEMTQEVGVDEAGGLWTAQGGSTSESAYELAATIEITEAVTTITKNFEKSYKELYIFFDKIKTSSDSQIVINGLGSPNSFATTNGCYSVARLIHRKGLGIERIDSLHTAYGFWQSAVTQHRFSFSDPPDDAASDFNSVIISPANTATTTITGGTIKIFGKV